ncbi:DNA repair protein complementing XP-C cells homolog [Geodia barretti]|uniref:DNA repair protein complementing XP-C cells homolog n=1 Tax=Geodia barretti TaxID=519541 RepID=A0AA35RLP8_GEOBA|nr:DNA repair protein complementing XP-C cells homolog [Geodia barretti]
MSAENTTQAGVYDETCSWAEAYAEDQRRYVCLHIPSSSVDQPKICEKHCPHKLSYVLAFESRWRGVCDRCDRSLCVRVVYSHQETAVEGFLVGRHPPPVLPRPRGEGEREEDILNILYSHPLPTSINDYKSHPLYVLRRHLLKFEAIYPVDSKILGYCRGEPVLSRDCVFTRDEEPYKVVKARPKKGMSLLERDASTVEVFGLWQTEVYVPPPVVDGVVPRNEYGNVELFQPSMLPAGARHIRIAGIQKVARKLEVSYVPAMIGWDFHSGHCCPVIDGIVVAEESEEMLMEAWRQEEQMMIEKEMKKREARVLERWKKLVRGVLIRERVQRTYRLT